MIFFSSYQHGVLLSRILTQRIDYQPSHFVDFWHMHGSKTWTSPSNLLEYRAHAQ